MRLNDSYLRSIAYVGCSRPGADGEIDATGTAFVVTHGGHLHLVTAAHVAVDYQDGPMDVRLNQSSDGLGRIYSIDTAKWYWHPDNKIDVAVMPFDPPSWARVTPFPTDYIATEFKVKTKDFGTGDLAYVVGMFNKMQGKKKNVPVVHTGHIGSMGAGEKLVTDDWRQGAKKGSELEVEGYLVQVPTLKGSSGSPVFVRRTLFLKNVFEEDAEGNKINIKAWTHGTVWLLGLWAANWTEKQRGKEISVGMGLCVPGPRIIEALDQPKLKRLRKAMEAKRKQQSKLTQQKSKPAKSAKISEVENPNHRADFDRLLTKAAQPVRHKE